MKKQLSVLFMAFFAVNFSAQNILTSPFTLGFLGDASANNAATNCVYIQNVGVSKVQFIQNSPQTIYVSQGNDIPGEVKLTDATGVDFLIPGFIKWRAPSGNSPSTMIFKPNVGVNQNIVIYNNGQNQVYNISSANYIGLTFSGQTLNIVGGQVTGNSASMLNILNNYVSTLAKLVVSNLSIAEEIGNANVIVTRSGNLTSMVTVDYTFVNGTALNGSDYVGLTGTLVIPSGSTSGSIVIPIIDNSMYELTEDFNVRLNNPNNSSITGGTAVVTITDSDSMVYGCMDTTACNFNPCVFQDNGTCLYPSQEQCNGIDDDCDGNIDNGFALSTFYADQDGDQYGDSNAPIFACAQGPGMVVNGGDCDDTNSLIHPGLAEICNGIDDDCDGVIDNGFDSDGDQWTTCEGDCNDNDPSINPGVLEGPFQAGSCDFIDNNCDGVVDEYWDQDQDGYTVCEGDCDDFNELIHPGVAELCNNIDDNCNNQVDENLTQYPVYTDADGDGYGVATGTTSCTPSTILPGDCNDTNSAIKPNATETCNNIDDNCNNQVDENLTQYAVYTDADGDGYGVATGTTSCTPSTILPGDCNDTNSAIKPSATETCNNIDDNCNNQVDESLISGCTDFTAFNYNPDANCDNGQCVPRIYGCTNAEACNYVPSANTDDSTCVVLIVESDTNNVCGNQPIVLNAVVTGLAPNSGVTMNNGPITGFSGPFFFENSSYYISSQITNWDNANAAAIAMGGQLAVINSNDELNYVKNLIGQNGVSPWIGLTQDVNAPDFSEPAGGWYWTNGVPFAFNWDLQYDTEPNNCAACCGSVENAGQLYSNGTFNDLCINTNTRYLVEFNQSASYTIVWSNGMQGNQIVVNNNGTNTYTANLTWPGGQCARSIAITTETPRLYYTDADGDGYGDINAVAVEACTAPTGSVDNNTDCDDNNTLVNPAQTEVCNDVDDNCNGQIDEGLTFVDYYTDSDLDGYGTDPILTYCLNPGWGYTTTSGDCDDLNPAINPAQTEVCGNDLDENCDGQVDDGCVYGCNDNTACNFDELANYDDGSCIYAQPETCNDLDDDCDGIVDNGVLNMYYVDADGDTYGDINDNGIEACTAPTGSVDNNTDCDDSNALVNPAQTEVCNDVDDNCDNIIDEGVKTMYYTDADGDGYGDINALAVEACTAPTGSVDNNTDCDDNNTLVNPAQTEVCNDVDDNCNGQIDEGLTFVDYYTDSDLDGYGTTPVLNYCLNPGLGYTTTIGDCDDLNPAINPAQTEVCGNDLDENCDGQVDNGCVYGCNDNTACNFDELANYDDGSCIYAQPETCNDLDDDCDGLVDNGVLNMYYVDADGDTYGDINDNGIEACTAPAGTVDNNTDCDDNNAAINPAATEVCNDADDNCDNIIDEGVKTMYYTDADGDGYGDINALAVEACTAPTGSVDNNTDCDDNNTLVNPAQTEVCNDVDDNCNGQIDEGLTFVDYYTDSDLDGYGTDPILTYCLNPGLGYTTTSGDCDDLNPAINPAQTEVCGNDLDENCDGQVDDGCVYGCNDNTACNFDEFANYDDGSCIYAQPETCNDLDDDCDGLVDNGVLNMYYVDADGDTYGDINDNGIEACTAPAGTVDNNTDCDDNNAAINPAATEVCNDADDNCDNIIDEGVKTMYYTDADGDGYGDINAVAVEACTAPTGSVDNNTDCDDNNTLVNPAQTEVCNDVDDNCNGQIDEGLTFVDYYTDSDLDGYGTDPILTYCLNPGLGYTTTSGDCDDLNPAINPAQTEVCGNDLDENCDGQVDDGCVYGCNDNTACNFDELANYDDGSCIYAQPETCNDLDDDCDGLVDNGVLNMYYVDADGDTYGDINDNGIEACTAPAGTVDNNTDCDDNNAAINPAATEVCNDADDNCDNIIDEGVKTMYYTDADGDGYGDINAVAVEACTAPTGSVDNNTDCDDNNTLVNPAQTEVCNDVDDNCNGQIDEGLTFVDYYTDSDLDGYGTTPVLNYCLNPGLGYTTIDGDCDDLNPAINPAQTEVCGNDLDENCDGQVDDGCVYGCNDNTACNFDELANYDDGSCIYAQPETCNDLDDDCDGIVDNGVLNMYYVDADGDTYGDINDNGIEACTAPTGSVDNNTDCDDSNALVNPAQTEVCNDVDDNCDNIIDEGVKTMYYTDADGDGYGDINALAVEACTAPTGSVDNNTDCDDNNTLVNPAQTEVCNDVDDNCNGQIDEGLTFVDYYTDSDLDGYGTTPVLNYCLNPGLGYTTTIGDCDDLNPAINPAQTEVCGNDLDENCDGQVDNGCVYGCNDNTACNFDELANYDDGSCIYAQPETCNDLDDDCDGLVDNGVLNMYYVDADGDTYGDINDNGIEACTAPAGTVDNNTDCDDNNAAINPAATEVCNDADDNCDNIIDEGVKTMYYTDADGDGYGDINALAVEACTAPTGSVDNNTDCDDNNTLVNPAQTEVCNDVDDNCNGQIDEGLTFVDYYTDSDLDGYGTDPILTYCLNPGLGYTTTSGDCDDLNPAINPAQTEVCGNDLDENCDGQVDDGCVYGCNDNTACNFDEFANYDDGSCIYAQPETCNDLDDDCDGLVDNGVLNMYYVDADGDGYGDINDNGIEACTAPIGTVDNNTDCDDNNEAINPAATEVCNDADDNCDNIIDEGVKTMYYTDADGDGYGDINAVAVEACTAPTGSVDNNTDCDDNNTLVNPAQTEVCNDVDDNCNGQIDEGLTFVDYYTDSDLDGYGTTPVLNYCLNPGLGYTTIDGDCDDLNPAINPAQTEVCGNDIDENCDGQVDDGCVYGCNDNTACNFDELANYDDGSCIYAQPETCNDLDDDCDGIVDNGVLNMYYVDADGDGYGDINDNGIEACTAPIGTVDNNTDCDDNNAAINPLAIEICDNAVDENCDGLAAQGCILGCMDDAACNYNAQATSDNGSCVYPQPEICNAFDDDCDGVVNNGLSMETLNTVTVNTAYFPACTPTNIFSANPFIGTNTATIDGDGKDRWYKWNAQYNSLRIGLSAAIGDYSIHLFREYPGCLALEMIEHEVTTGNQTLITDELTVGANYYFAVHEHAGPGNTSAKLCINHFLPSDCDHFYSNGTGEYGSVCRSFKTLYRGNANNYMINVLAASQAGQNLGIQPWVYQAGSSSVIARLGSILPSNLSASPIVYTVNVPVMYSIPDAAENYTPVFAKATSTCTITLLPQTPIQVRASDRCPNIKAINSYIAPDQTICGSIAYQWEFTDCTNGVSNATTQVLTGANGSSIFMLNNIPGIAPGKFYQVRVRPVHTSGVVSAWGAVQCVMIQGSGMVAQEENTSAIKVSSEMGNVLVYPNPTTTGDVNIVFEKPLEGQLNVEVTNLLGQQVYSETLDFSGVAHKLNLSRIAKGMFQMTIRINGMEQTTRLVRD